MNQSLMAAEASLARQTEPSCFEPSDIKALANYRRTCEVVKKDLVSTQLAFNQCVQKACEPAVFGDKAIVIPTLVLSFLIGFLAAAQLTH